MQKSVNFLMQNLISHFFPFDFGVKYNISMCDSPEIIGTKQTKQKLYKYSVG